MYPIDVPLSRAFLASMHPINMHFTDVHLLGVHLAGVRLMGVYLRAFQIWGFRATSHLTNTDHSDSILQARPRLKYENWYVGSGM